MEFIWNDGGRAESGYIGLVGDCVTRAISIATGICYRDVYKRLGDASLSTPRNGVRTDVAATFLKELGWKYASGGNLSWDMLPLPTGPVIVHLVDDHRPNRGHFTAVIDHTLYDTWNPSEDDYSIRGFWTRPDRESPANEPGLVFRGTRDAETTLTQQEFDRVLHRLRSLDNTASNSASTEGEKRNALRMMQNLMLRHNLSREDISGDDNVDNVHMARMACPVNGRRACNWEKDLASYLVKEIFPLLDWYFTSKKNRTLIFFYGPLDDVTNCLTLYRELLLTIATSARLRYGGYSRGSGASYAEGYVRGLPRYHASESKSDAVVSETALIHARTLAMHTASRRWLGNECGVHLHVVRGSGRDQHDPEASKLGKEHGSKHDVTGLSGRKRLTSG